MTLTCGLPCGLMDRHVPGPVAQTAHPVAFRCEPATVTDQAAGDRRAESSQMTMPGKVPEWGEDGDVRGTG